jgi:hypothetical protein
MSNDIVHGTKSISVILLEKKTKIIPLDDLSRNSSGILSDLVTFQRNSIKSNWDPTTESFTLCDLDSFIHTVKYF